MILFANNNKKPNNVAGDMFNVFFFYIFFHFKNQFKNVAFVSNKSLSYFSFAFQSV